MPKKLIIILVLLIAGKCTYAQKERKVNFIGGARSYTSTSQLSVTDSIPDTTTIKNTAGGYALIDLGVNIKPNKSTEIMGMFRIKNNFGGFWGAGVEFDVRQLWIKGVIANAVRYQVGDLNLKQTEFTLFNHHSDQIDSLPAVFNLQKDIVDYERFYLNNNTWRMQGANVDFGFTFSKYAKELNVSTFVARVNATDFSSTAERLMAGMSLHLLGNKYYQIGYNVNSVFDVKGTVSDSNLFKNYVNTIDWRIRTDLNNKSISFNGEIGKSNYKYTEDTLAPNLDDYFVNAYAVFELSNYHIQATLGYLNVGPEFRSIGSQSKDVNYDAQPEYYNRYTNDQSIRPIALFDIIGNENVYNRTLSSKFMREDATYNNALPYGLATFNRVGMYAKIQYKAKNEIAINGEYYNLNEIRGQGTLALRNFNLFKLYTGIPINKLINYNKTLLVEVAANYQTTERNSSEAVENVDLTSTRISAGLRWEFFRNFELLGGYINQENKGNEFIAERNDYTEVTYFTNKEYKLNQQILAAGLRYNFSPIIYICGLYQSSTYTDKQNLVADFGFDQFGLIFNMTF
jgi:hypothetical protein